MEHTPADFWTPHAVNFTLQGLIISARLSIIDERFIPFTSQAGKLAQKLQGGTNLLT